jgi:phosphatidylglycerol:prolipoprotein diacylglycerol transferase
MAGARFFNEYFREPDAHLADRVIETGLSQGQWLSIPMFLAGVAVIIYALVRKDPAVSSRAPQDA